MDVAASSLHISTSPFITTVSCVPVLRCGINKATVSVEKENAILAVPRILRMRDARSPSQGLPTTRLAFGVCRGTTSHVGSSFLTHSCFYKESSCSPTTCSHDTTSLCLLQLLRYCFFFSSDYLRLISSFCIHQFVWEPWKPGEGGKSGVSEASVNELSSPPDAISQGDWRRVAGSIDSSSLQQEFNRSSCKSL